MWHHGAVLPLKADAATNTENAYPVPPVLPPRFAGGGAGSAYAAARAALEAHAAEQAEAAAREPCDAHAPPGAGDAARAPSAAQQALRVPGAQDCKSVLDKLPAAGAAGRAEAMRALLSGSSSEDEEAATGGGAAAKCEAGAGPVAPPPANAPLANVPRALDVIFSEGSSSDEEDAALAALCQKYGVGREGTLGVGRASR
jgi:hypothetical protein